MTTLSEINEYEDRLNKRLIIFGEIQKGLEKQRQEMFLDNVDKAYQEEKDRIASQEPFKWEMKHADL